MATDRFGGIVDDEPTASGPQRDRFGGLVEADDAPAGPSPSAPAVNPNARKAGDYIRSRMAAGQKFDADTIAATYDAFEQQARGAGPATVTNIAPENALERAALGVSRAVARPVTGAVGLINPSGGTVNVGGRDIAVGGLGLRKQQASIYGHGGLNEHDDTAGFVGETAGGATQAPLVFTPLGRVISAAEAAGNKRIDIAERRARGEDVSGMEEIGNAAGAAGIDLLANKANVGTVNKVIAGKLVGKPMLEVGARLATEAAGATAIGFGRTLADNATNRATSGDATPLTAGIDLRSGIANAVTGLALAGLTTRPTSRGSHATPLDGSSSVGPHAGVLDPANVGRPVGPDGGDATTHPALQDVDNPVSAGEFAETIEGRNQPTHMPETVAERNARERLADQQAMDAELGDVEQQGEPPPIDLGPNVGRHPLDLMAEQRQADQVVSDQQALQDRLDAVQQEPVIPKTPEQLAAEQRAAIEEQARQETFKHATFEDPSQIPLDPEAQAAADRVTDATSKIDFNERRSADTAPVESNPGRRFEDFAQNATFQTPEEAGAGTIFARAAARKAASQPVQPSGGGGNPPKSSAPMTAAPSGVTIKPNIFQRAAARLRPRGNLPHVVDALNQLRKGEAEAQIKEGRNDLTVLEPAIQKDYGKGADKLTPDESAVIYDALAGDQSAVAQLGPETHAAVQKMRATIDKGTDTVLGTSAIKDIGTRTRVNANKGQYLERRYLVHEDPNFQPGKEAYDNAVAHLMQPPKNKKGQVTGPGLTEEQARARVEGMLADWKKVFDATPKKVKLGAMDVSTLIKRKNLDPWIRDLMGEDKNPFTAFTRTLGSQAELAANAKFLDRVKAAGKGGGWLFDKVDAPEGFTTRIAGKNDKTYKPLGGQRTTAEVAKALTDTGTTAKRALPMYQRLLLTANQWAKEAATVGSVMTQVRNALGQPIFNIGSGHNPVTPRYWTAIKDALSDQFKSKASPLIVKATKYGVLGDNVSTYMLKQELDRAGTKDLAQDNNNSALARARRAVQTVRGWGRDAYAVPDNVGKLVGWQAEIDRAKAAYPNWTEDAQMAHAADRVRNTYPSPSRTPAFMKAVKNTPFGPFAGFWYEAIRTYGNNLYYGATDLTTGVKTGNKALARQGSARLAGSLSLATAGAVASAVSKSYFGISDEEEENLRNNLPDYRANKNFVFTGKEPGKIGWADLSAFNPYASMFDAVRGFSRPNDLTHKLVQSVREFFGPLTGSEQLIDSAITDVRRNRTELGGRIYNPEDSFPEQWAAITGHLLAPIFVPGTLKRLVNKIIPSLQGKELAGQALVPSQEIGAEVTGLRQGTTNFDTALGQRAKEFLGAGRDIHSAFLSKAAVPGASEADVTGAYDKLEGQRAVRFKQMQALVDGALRSGLTKSQVGARLKASGVSVDVIGQLFANKYQPWNPALSGLKDVEAVRNNKAYPVKPLMERYRAAVAARKEGGQQ